MNLSVKIQFSRFLLALKFFDDKTLVDKKTSIFIYLILKMTKKSYLNELFTRL
jgi:hypothetical protein